MKSSIFLLFQLYVCQEFTIFLIKTFYDEFANYQKVKSLANAEAFQIKCSNIKHAIEGLKKKKKTNKQNKKKPKF